MNKEQSIHELVLSIRQGRDFKSMIHRFYDSQSDLNELIQIIVNQEEYPLAEYASWILVHLTKARPFLVQPYIEQLVDALFVTENQSVLRNVTNIVNLLSITEHRESEFIDLLIGFIQDANNKVALQVYSMYILIQFISIYPELKQEIIEIIELNSTEKSAAYKSAYRKFLRKTKNN